MGALLSQFLNKFPYTDFHELNADWMIRTMVELINQVENFVSLNAIKYADPIQWNITSQYEKNTVVIDPLTGTAYISVQPVPMGVILTNTDYWTVIFDLGSFVTRAAKNFTNRYEADTTLTATFASNVGDWLVWGDTLYKAITNIVAGDQYVVDSNIQAFTIEELVGHLENLTTNNKSSIVNAINETVNHIDNIFLMTITMLKNLTAHFENANVEGATFASNVGDWLVLGDSLYKVIANIAVDDQYVVDTNIQAFTIEELVGHLDDLTTTDASNIVNAINSLKSGLDWIAARFNSDRVRNGSVRKVICIGDSYLGGSGIPYQENDSWGAKLRELLNNGSDTILNGYGGSGFIGQPATTTYIQLLQQVAATLTDGEKQSISDIVVQGGLNDKYGLANNTYTAADIIDAIHDFTEYAHETFVNAVIRIGVAGWATDGLSDKQYWGTILECFKQCADANAANYVQFMEGLEYIMPTIPDSEYYDAVHPDVAASMLIARGIFNCMMGGNGNMGHRVTRGGVALTYKTGITPLTTGFVYSIYGETAEIFPGGLLFSFDNAVNYTFGQSLAIADITNGVPVRASQEIKIPAWFWVEHSDHTNDSYAGYIIVHNKEISIQLCVDLNGTTILQCWAYGTTYSDSVFNIC